MRAGTIATVSETVTVTHPDGTQDRMILAEEHEDGAILLRPDTSYEAMSERAPGRTATSEEFEEVLGPHLRAPDDEG